MGKLLNQATVLLVKDVIASANHYRDKLGFTFDRFWGEPPCFCMVWRDNRCIMLQQADKPSQVRPNADVLEDAWNAYFWVEDVDSLFDELKQRGASIEYEPFSQPYGCREFGVQDRDGYRIAFGEEIELEDEGESAG